MYDGSNYNDEIIAPLAIKEVSYCIITELTFRYGRLHYLTSWAIVSQIFYRCTYWQISIIYPIPSDLFYFCFAI